ncbi:EAL domain-containing protein [Xylophilus rhododendri]|uniref:EAL domain-containing protein n=1 Tax=Xylophilus rhododendri TaxID=2697032 RepID=A0A857J0I6_9BURK|nr:EAL domain-containing protein [Xylophilus rhododendri]QHI96783.1 EAL domain-containing protein [Xylophilus rhododendri]
MASIDRHRPGRRPTKTNPREPARAETLLIFISGFHALQAIDGHALRWAGRAAVHRALVAAGIAESAIHSHGDLFLIDLLTISIEQFSCRLEIDRLMLRLQAAIGREPVEIGARRAYLQVGMDLLYQSAEGVATDVQEAFLAEMPHAADDAAGHYLERRLSFQPARQLGYRLLDELREGSLRLAFQPVVRMTETGVGDCLYHEVLLRRDPAGQAQQGSVADAIAALERLGLVGRLDCSVMWTTLQLLELYPQQRLGCNVSARSFADSAWWRLLLGWLEARRGIAERLTVEITETSPLGGREPALALIGRLQACGVRLAVDDFGAGHSTLEFLSQARADVVKIDRSVLLRSRDTRHSPDLLRNLARVCADYSPCVVVEGVETDAELDAARRAGANGVQGFLIERPDTRPAWLTHGVALVADAHGLRQPGNAIDTLAPRKARGRRPKPAFSSASPPASSQTMSPPAGSAMVSITACHAHD